MRCTGCEKLWEKYLTLSMQNIEQTCKTFKKEIWKKNRHEKHVKWKIGWNYNKRCVTHKQKINTFLKRTAVYKMDYHLT